MGVALRVAGVVRVVGQLRAAEEALAEGTPFALFWMAIMIVLPSPASKGPYG